MNRRGTSTNGDNKGRGFNEVPQQIWDKWQWRVKKSFAIEEQSFIITCNLAISSSKQEIRPGGIPIFLAMAAAKVESNLWITDSCVAGVDDLKLFEYRRSLLD